MKNSAYLHVLVGGYLIVAVGHFPSEVPSKCFRHVNNKTRKGRTYNHLHLLQNIGYIRIHIFFSDMKLKLPI